MSKVEKKSSMFRHAAFVVAVGVLSAVTGRATAGIITDPSAGALQLQLTFDSAGNATLMNTTGSALSVKEYQIVSDGGNLLPTGWISIADMAVAAPVTLMTTLGTGALGFGEMQATTTLLAEGSLNNSALFQPGAPWSIGTPIAEGTLASDLTLYYSRPDSSGNMYLGQVVPEPATLSLLALGGLAVLRRKRTA
jgi:hypothetical protein